MKLVIKLLLSTVALWAMAYITPGVEINNFAVALVAVLVISAINLFIKPILSILTLPVNFLTLGLLGVVINILLFMLVASLVEGFTITNFLSGAIGLLVYSLLQTVLNILE